MKHLKKFAALFIVASLSLCFTGYLSIETNAVENVDNRISFEEYSTLLFDLLNEYEVNNADNSEHCLKSGENESQQLKRLIVETYSNEALQEDCGSIDKVEGYDNVHILQYDTHDDAEAALRNKATAWLSGNDINSPTISMTVSFIHLWQSPEYASFAALEKVSLCDWVTVRHAGLGIDV